MIILRVWIVTVCFAAVALARSWTVGIPIKDPGGAFFVTRVGLTLALFVGVRRDRGCRPDAAWPAVGEVRCGLRPVDAGRGRRLAAAWACLLAYHVVYLSYHNLKSWDVLNTPRDHDLTRIDQWLFLGHSPAVLLHDLLGQGVAAYALLLVYEAFPTVVVLVVAGSVFTRELRDGITVLTSLIWVWILGTLHLLRGAVPGSLRRPAAGLRRAPGDGGDQDPGAVHGAAGPPPGPPARTGRVRAGLGVREPARRQ